MTKQTYLVAVDGSEWGNRAADHAVHTAQQTGAKVILITVVPWSGFQPMTLDEVAHRTVNKQEEEAQAQNGILTPLEKKYKDSGVTVATEHHWGNPAEVIHKRAKETKANQIFVGRRGRSRLADLVLGSVANSLAHTVGKPIVLVP